MSVENTSKVTGKEIAGGYRMTTTGTMIGNGIIARKRKSGVGATTASNGDRTPDRRIRLQLEEG
jgi:hypothetical protein